MHYSDLTITIIVDQSPKKTFDAINHVTGWWTENLEGGSTQLNDEFTVQFGDVHYSKQRVVEITPDKKVVWLVIESNLSFTQNKSEWTGTKISFDITPKQNKTQVLFTHQGLTPAIECYDGCSGAWGDYIGNSLKEFINSEKGHPAAKEKVNKK